ncbi:MAG: hypothetical protein JXN60_02600 [Lentisphaerae bacterium]|nr:hypothetical protein [Lentisphaerota bacterium]
MNDNKKKKALRSERAFDYFIGAGCDCFAGLMNVNIKNVFLDPGVGIEIHQKGRDLVQSLLGEDIPIIMPICTPVIKYGHANCLGVDLKFPDAGQVGIKSHFTEYEQAIEFMGEKVDFASAGMTPFYLDYYDRMKKAFPDEKIHWGWQWEGPVTTAWELAGDRFMYDLYDQPVLLKEFMCAVTESIVDYCEFFREVEGTDVLDPEPDHGRVCDDIAAMLPPEMWPAYVLPYWRMYFEGPVSEAKVHCEDMKSKHLKYLDEAGIVDYDSGISPKLNPKMIRENTSAPFGWRLGSFHYDSMTARDVSDFVFQAVADGASYVFTFMDAIMCKPETLAKVRVFHHAAEKAKQMLQSGKTLDDVADMVSPDGRRKFWDHWPSLSVSRT